MLLKKKIINNRVETVSWTLLKPLMSHDHFFGHPQGLEAKTADRK